MKSTDKLKNYFEQYTREKYFMDRIYQIRKDIGIPEDGISDKIPPRLSMDYIGFIMGVKYKDKVYPTFPAKMTKIYAELLKPVPKIYRELLVIQFINIFILYNKRDYCIFEKTFEHFGNSVGLINFKIEYLEHKDCCDCELKVCENYMKETSDRYPIMIGISPYATQNEVIDLIKKRWNYMQFHFNELEKDNDISKFQKEKKELSKIKTRSTKSKKIEDIVYKNKEYTLNEIRKIIKQKTGIILDPGEVGKIKSLAIKRREKSKK